MYGVQHHLDNRLYEKGSKTTRDITKGVKSVADRSLSSISSPDVAPGMVSGETVMETARISNADFLVNVGFKAERCSANLVSNLRPVHPI